VCGRFTLTTPAEILAEAFGLDAPPDVQPRYNIAPSQPVALVRHPMAGSRRAELVRWGLVPAWTGRPWSRPPMINARADSAARSPAFRAAFTGRRCLILADGFYEWRADPGARSKQPFFIHMADRSPFAFAGLWEPPAPGPAAEETCAILTTRPNTLVERIHDRMPVILDPRHYDRWLDPTPQDQADLEAMLVPFPAEAMTAFPVSRLVGNPRNDTPACTEPLPSPTT